MARCPPGNTPGPWLPGKPLLPVLARAYQRRDPELFGALLARDSERNAEYTSLLSGPTEFGELSWGWEDELRIHRRMFRPENPPPGEDPVPPALWLQAVDIDLQPLAAFQERDDLYSTEENCPDGKCADGKLDRKVWRVVYAQYSTDVFFQLAGERDYQVDGSVAKANFVVIEDRTKKMRDDGKFLLFVWEDITSPLLSGLLTSSDPRVPSKSVRPRRNRFVAGTLSRWETSPAHRIRRRIAPEVEPWSSCVVSSAPSWS